MKHTVSVLLFVVSLVGSSLMLSAQTNTIQLRNGANSTTILPSASSTITVQIPALSAGTHYLLTSTTNPGSSGAAGSFITYGATSAQNTLDISATNYLFNVGYAATAVEQVALGGLITSTATGTDKNATALTLAATGTGTGTSTALYITNGRLTFTDSDDSHTTSFTTGDQAANINYTLPTADGTNGQVLSTNGSGALSWNTPSSVGAINDLTDAVKGITDFTNSMILGHETTGTLDNADENTAVGIASMQSITSGDQNTALGYASLATVTSGSQNTALGYASLATVTSGSQNTAVGYTAGYEITTGTLNVCLGHEAGYGIQDGSNNIAIGYGVYRDGAINASPVGSYNIGIGGAALYNGPFGNSNIAVGQSAMANAADAANNIAIGYEAGNGVTSGDDNVLLGYQAGRTLTTGTGNVFIGYQTGSGVAVGTSNTLMISNSNDATPLIQGDFSANTLTFNGATTTTGNVTISGTTTYSAPGTAKAVTANTTAGAGAQAIASFTNTYERVDVTATTATGYVKLPAGATDGQIVYLHMIFTANGSNTVTIVNSDNSNTTMVYDGTGADHIIAHMMYTTAKGWVIFSALEYD
jgi:hypothetical protein